jgi:DNA-binding CsgD family transcriptional regulator
MLSNLTALALEWGAKAIKLATELNEMEILSHALNNVGTAKLTKSDLSGQRELKQSLALALEGGFREQAARAYTNLATRAVGMREFKAARGYLDDGIAFCEKYDLDAWGRYMTVLRARVALDLGHWAEAVADAEAVARHPRTAPISKIPALVVLGLIRARRGEEGAAQLLDEARYLALPTGEMQRLGLVTIARAEAAWLQGDIASMADELAWTAELAAEQPEPWMDGELAFWRWRCNPMMRNVDGCAGPFVDQIAGARHKAAVAWRAFGCDYQCAMALADSEDEQELREALQICDRLGAAPLAGILRRKLRAGGIRGISRGAQERNRQNPHGLTTRELGVLSQLTEGCRNADIARRLFVSEKTVDHHVSSILGKLGVRSRGEAAAMANRLGLAPTFELAKVAMGKK